LEAADFFYPAKQTSRDQPTAPLPLGGATAHASDRPTPAHAPSLPHHSALLRGAPPNNAAATSPPRPPAPAAQPTPVPPTSPAAQDLPAQIEVLHEQLRQAQKMSSLGALASSITHEFNNILTSVINYSKLGLRHRDPATRERAFEKILHAGQRAAKLTSGVLAYARKRGDRRQACDVIGLIQEALLLVERDLNKHRIRLHTRFEGRPQAVVNGNQIQQVLLNLIINARQAMQPGGQLLLSARSNPHTGMVELGVADTGSGIAPEKLPSIFEPFFSTKSGPDATGKGGTGLGLSLCRDIIEAHQGKIRVDSTLGKGTTFTLKLPAAGPKPAPAAQASRT
jgi:signal transduction histidine kinase